MSDKTETAPADPRGLTSLPIAPHGHQIQSRHRTVLPEEGEVEQRRLAEILGTAGGHPPADQASLVQLCADYPAFLDGWAHLAEAVYLAGDPVFAYACARVGYHRGLDRLRKSGWGGTGQVRWADPSNRGFLRSLYMLMATAAEVGEEDELARCRQFLIDLDPEDGLGIGARPQLAPRQKLGAGELP